MEKFVIQGGIPLQGDITPSGNKNAALPILAASILTQEPVILNNVPEIRDVHVMTALLKSLGAQVEKIGSNTIKIVAKDIQPSLLDPELCKKIRASILLAGPMIARSKKLSLPPPGGDVIGRRRVDTHIIAFRSLGASVEYHPDERLFKFYAPELIGNNILLDEASVTATENAIMASVLAKGDTIISNAASEPHIQELCQFLNKMGADIQNIGSNRLYIHGVQKLHGTVHEIGPDYLEVVSYIGASVVTHGSIRIKNAGVANLDMIRTVFNRIGVDWITDKEDIIVPAEQELHIKPDLGNAIPEISVMPWPAFPTDLMSIAIVVATQSTGSVLFHDWMYPGRMFFTDKLVGMGANVILCDPHRCIVQGPTTLYGEKLESPDIRAGMALLLAALAAKGQSTIKNIGQIDRGYEKVDIKLKKLGAKIERINSIE